MKNQKNKVNNNNQSLIFLKCFFCKVVEKKEEKSGYNISQLKSTNLNLLDFWTSQNYTNLEIVEENKYKSVMKGKNKYT